MNVNEATANKATVENENETFENNEEYTEETSVNKEKGLKARFKDAINSVKDGYATELPTALSELRKKRIAMAALIAFVSIVLAIFYKVPGPLAMLAVSAVLLGQNVKMRVDFAQGKYHEIVTVCASVNNKVMRNAVRVVFTTFTEDPDYYEFTVPGRKSAKIFPNYTYVIYFRDDMPKVLTAFTQL